MFRKKAILVTTSYVFTLHFYMVIGTVALKPSAFYGKVYNIFSNSIHKTVSKLTKQNDTSSFVLVIIIGISMLSSYYYNLSLKFISRRKTCNYWVPLYNSCCSNGYWKCNTHSQMPGHVLDICQYSPQTLEVGIPGVTCAWFRCLSSLVSTGNVWKESRAHGFIPFDLFVF